jgi:hypothetical protein
MMLSQGGLRAKVDEIKQSGRKPINSVTCAAGKDFGVAELWEDVDGFRIVKVYDNSTTACHGVYDSDLVGEGKMVDLYSFLIREIDPMDVDDVCVANIRGATSIPEASEDDDGPFGVLITRYFFNVEQTAWAELEDGRYDRLSFDSYFEALEWIAEQEKGIYHLSHNEHSRPDYKIVNE